VGEMSCIKIVVQQPDWKRPLKRLLNVDVRIILNRIFKKMWAAKNKFDKVT
jgi:hypothetical protein